MRFIATRKKRPAEILAYAINFQSDIDAAGVDGDELLSQMTTASILSGSGTDSGTFINFSTVSGNKVVFRVQNGTAATKYLVNVKATTVSGLIYEHDVVIECRADS